MSSLKGTTQIRWEALDAETLAKLLASVGTRKKRRPYDAVTVAELFARTGMTDVELAAKLSVHPQTIRMFKKVLKLPPDVRELVRSGKVTRDEADRISRLEDVHWQRFLAEAIVADALSPDLVKDIVTLKRRNPHMGMKQCIEQVLEAQPVVEDRYIFVTQINEAVIKAIEMESKNCGIPFSEVAKSILQESLPREGLLSFVARGQTVLVTFTKEGWKAVSAKCDSSGVSLEELVESLLKEWLGKERKSVV